MPEQPSMNEFNKAMNKFIDAIKASFAVPPSTEEPAPTVISLPEHQRIVADLRRKFIGRQRDAIAAERDAAKQMVGLVSANLSEMRDRSHDMLRELRREADKFDGLRVDIIDAVAARHRVDDLTHASRAEIADALASRLRADNEELRSTIKTLEDHVKNQAATILKLEGELKRVPGSFATRCAATTKTHEGDRAQCDKDAGHDGVHRSLSRQAVWPSVSEATTMRCSARNLRGSDGLQCGRSAGHLGEHHASAGEGTTRVISWPAL